MKRSTKAAIELNKARWSNKKWRSEAKRSKMGRKMARVFWDKATPAQRKEIGARLKKARLAKKA